MSNTLVSLAVICLTWALLLFVSAQQRRTRVLMNRTDDLLKAIKVIAAEMKKDGK